jgi:chromosome segregation ATPase
MLSILKPRSAPKASCARLKAAIAARDQAIQAVNDQRATVERLQTVIDGADDASRAAAAATRAANDARQDWVRDGCLQHAKTHHALAETAAAAAQVAQSASADADAVRKQLRRAQEEIESRQAAIGHAEHEITAAVSVIIAQESAELLAEFEAAAATYRQLREKVMGLSITLAKPWGLDYKNRSNPSAEGENIVDAAMERASIKTWDRHVDGRRDAQAYVDALTAPLRELAARLREDPDAN